MTGQVREPAPNMAARLREMRESSAFAPTGTGG
jgi:hypothetical protein